MFTGTEINKFRKAYSAFLILSNDNILEDLYDSYKKKKIIHCKFNLK